MSCTDMQLNHYLLSTRIGDLPRIYWLDHAKDLVPSQYREAHLMGVLHESTCTTSDLGQINMFS
ncbi:hypothetical protein EJ08DRAFT_207866 [Tothia fuscella]|uniref:Uncharacterized protein n=1 Tax=Tothia fuscella TaxID=1048955 RepID=A0A9P4NTB6_9PEZI|nr:hypothetical protein EJ08DRAFT_207866 [Tothia fuscella]